MVHTEDKIALSLYSHLVGNRRHDVILPNFFIGDYECDMIRFKEDGSIIEYEIKTSVKDFRKDFSKKRKGKYKHKELAAGLLPPSQFYFVVPSNLLKPEDIPSYAGLMYVSQYGAVSTIKRAPFLHKRKYMDSMVKYKDLAIKLSFREIAWRRKYEELKIKRNEDKTI